MIFEYIIFYLFSGILLLSSTMVVVVRNPVFAALFLVLSFFTAAILWVTMQAEFLGIVLVLVYVGAVMVLFLFVIMMLNLELSKLKQFYHRYMPIGLLVAVTMAVELIIVLTPEKLSQLQQSQVSHPAEYNNTAELGRQLYTDYMYPFEIAAVILLVAIIAAIVLTMRRRPGTKHQDPGKQVLVQAKDRVKVVSIDVERRD
ncbi:MAG: NADH-quinone oxidoreductase subunit J [Methylococcales bacterium]|jgi:NADH-quinone oxidoreductase subunit J|nr:NADH-quinone oxidoreductase subunit J [Methylococcales bacterium]MBT7442608.1 NADH-quinone oxidoreductase subunit J [Methylococcales bacterium]